MDNKTIGEAHFCADLNVKYLAGKVGWQRSLPELKTVVLAFLENYKGYSTSWNDPWATCRNLNRLFIESIDINPSTATTYSSVGQTIFMQEEVWV